MMRWTAASGAALAMVWQGAPAQTQQDVESISVTGTGEEIAIQDEPITVSVLDEEFFELANVQRFEDLPLYVPGVVFLKGFGQRSSSTAIRGLGDFPLNDGQETRVGVFLDGVYLSRQAMALSDLFDIDRVEILRGPQDTLLGRSTSAGALNVVTNAPTDRFEATAQLTAGDFSYLRGEGAISGAVTDWARLRLAAYGERRDPTIENVGDDLPDADDLNRYGVRARGDFDLASNILLRLSADWRQLDEDCCAEVAIDRSAFRERFFTEAFDIPLPAADAEEREAGFDRIGTTNENVGGMAELVWDFPAFTLRAQSALRLWDAEEGADLDGTVRDELTYEFTNDLEQFTQSLEIEGSLFGDRLNFVAGTLFFGSNNDSTTESRVGEDGLSLTGYSGFEDIIGEQGLIDLFNGVSANQVFQQSFGLPNFFGPFGDVLSPRGGITFGQLAGLNNALPLVATGNVQAASQAAQQTLAGLSQMVPPSVLNDSAFIPGIAFGSDDEGRTRSYSLYFNGEYEFTDRISVVAGLRTTYERKTGEGTTVVQTRLDPASGIDTYDAEIDNTFVTGRIGAKYYFTPNANAYVTFSTGHQPAGINVGSIDFADFPNDDDPRTFDEETTLNYETGLKASFFQGRLITNLGLFWIEVSDLQSNLFTQRGFLINNLGDARSRGLEGEVIATLTNRLEFSGSFAYLDAEFTDAPNFQETPTSLFDGVGTVDLTGTDLPLAPAFSSNANLTYERVVLNNFIARGRLEHAFVDDYITSLDTGATQPAYHQINVSGAFGDLAGRWELSLWGRNMTDEAITTLFRGQPTGESGSAILTDPRTWGATLRVRY